MRDRLPVHAERGRDVHVGADAEPAAIEGRVHLERLADMVEPDADQGIPQAGLAREVREVSQPDVVPQRVAADAAGDIEGLVEPDAPRRVEVDGVHIHAQLRIVGPVTADGRPQPVDIDSP